MAAIRSPLGATVGRVCIVEIHSGLLVVAGPAAVGPGVVVGVVVGPDGGGGGLAAKLVGGHGNVGTGAAGTGRLGALFTVDEALVEVAVATVTGFGGASLTSLIIDPAGGFIGGTALSVAAGNTVDGPVSGRGGGDSKSQAFFFALAASDRWRVVPTAGGRRGVGGPRRRAHRTSGSSSFPYRKSSSACSIVFSMLSYSLEK